MKSFQVEVKVLPRSGILDPQGTAVHGALRSLGFREVGEAHVGRLIRLEVRAASREEARERAERMCRELLANPVTEDWSLVLDEGEESGVD